MGRYGEPDEDEERAREAKQAERTGDKVWGCLREAGGCLLPSLPVLLILAVWMF